MHGVDPFHPYLSAPTLWRVRRGSPVAFLLSLHVVPVPGCLLATQPGWLLHLSGWMWGEGVLVLFLPHVWHLPHGTELT
jgi:hypothetical protein